jgi:hypothetical protein
MQINVCKVDKFKINNLKIARDLKTIGEELKSHHTAHSLPFQKNQKRNCEGSYNKRKEQRCFVLSIFRTLPGLNFVVIEL